ncbi:hypothetical protein BOX15_Mlig003955g1, partial [Macrostomum lignano]
NAAIYNPAKQLSCLTFSSLFCCISLHRFILLAQHSYMHSPKRRSLNLSSTGSGASPSSSPAINAASSSSPSPSVSSLSPAASRLTNPFKFLSASMSPGLPSMDENMYYVRKGTNGFDELKRYIKQGNDLCKELSAILVERCELEHHYARSLVKISQRMAKVAATCAGTVAASWGSIGESIKREAEIRQEFAANLSDEVTKPMRELNESFHKSRKPIEVQVEKSIRTLLEKRAEEATAKKKAYCSAKEAEKAWDSLSDAQIGKKGSGGGGSSNGDAKADKDASKQEKKCRACQASMSKCDKDYYDACLRAELARLDWESTVAKGSEQLQALETDRLRQTHEMLERYQRRVDQLAPAYAQLSGRLHRCLSGADIEADIGTVVEQRGALLQASEQLLFESYAEDLNNPMDRCRRETALRSYTAMICADIEREIKGREGVEKLIQVYSSSPGFAEAASQHEAASKLASISSTLLFLEASRYKQELALHALAGSPPPCRPVFSLAHCLERSKDRLGMPQTVLRLAPALRRASSAQSADSSNNSSTAAGHATAASAGAAALPDLRDYGADDVSREAASGGLLNCRHLTDSADDLDDPTYAQLDLPQCQASDTAPPTSARRQRAPLPPPHPTQLSTTAEEPESESPAEAESVDAADAAVRVCGWARALFDYPATGDDELSLREGDVVSVLEKCADGWWLGEDSSGNRGIFPGSYAEDF